MQPINSIAPSILAAPTTPEDVLLNQSANETKNIVDFFATFECQYQAQVSAKQAVVSWLRCAVEGRNTGLVLWSKSYGCGKTHLAKCADRVLAWSGRRGVFVTAPDFLEQIRKTYNEKATQTEWNLFKHWGSGYFILDDFGKQYSREAEWEQEKFFKLFDVMYERQPFMVTSNFSPDEMSTALSGAAWDRLAGMCGPSAFVNMSDIPSYRLLKAGIK